MGSDWTVHLAFEEGTSSKFWRARVDGKTLYVNYGKIGTTGQTQVKDLGSPSAAAAEYDKLVREKRKKGYLDAGAAAPEPEADEDDGDEGGDDEPATAPARKPAKPAPAAAPAPKPAARPSTPGHRMILDAGNRKVETTLYLEGATLRMETAESCASPDAAKKAFERLKKMLAGEGYKDA
jgi:predicted DNA-binding WGR domain protein